jgi:hypothetical protein
MAKTNVPQIASSEDFAALVEYLDQPARPMTGRMPVPYSEDDDRRYLINTMSVRQRLALTREAADEGVDPVTREPLPLNFDSDACIDSGKDRVYGIGASDFGNYIDWLRNY